MTAENEERTEAGEEEEEGEEKGVTQSIVALPTRRIDVLKLFKEQEEKDTFI